jgi:hypothetical protein
MTRTIEENLIEYERALSRDAAIIFAGLVSSRGTMGKGEIDELVKESVEIAAKIMKAAGDKCAV